MFALAAATPQRKEVQNRQFCGSISHAWACTVELGEVVPGRTRGASHRAMAVHLNGGFHTLFSPALSLPAPTYGLSLPLTPPQQTLLSLFLCQDGKQGEGGDLFGPQFSRGHPKELGCPRLAMVAASHLAINDQKHFAGCPAWKHLPVLQCEGRVGDLPHPKEPPSLFPQPCHWLSPLVPMSIATCTPRGMAQAQHLHQLLLMREAEVSSGCC